MTDQHLPMSVVVKALVDMALITSADTPKTELISEDKSHTTFKVEANGRTFLVRISQTDRCAAEHFYMKTAADLVPKFRPQVLGFDGKAGVLVHEWLDPREYKSLGQELFFEEFNGSYSWSTPFHAEPDDNGVAFDQPLRAAGEWIGRIHSQTVGMRPPAPLRRAWPPRKNMPGQEYWRILKASFPKRSDRLDAIADSSAKAELVLLHGKLSPASIRFSETNVAIVDADHAAVGDPAFDLAHMMAHLCLASLHRGSCGLLTDVGSFHGGYARSLGGFDKVALMHRAGPLSAALLLALVQTDEVSSYLSVNKRRDLASFAEWWLDRRDYTIGQVRNALWTAIDMGFNDKLIDWRQLFAAVPRADR
jgi:aminoglycoside phosphotransferase (APT) family kinase protein